MEKPISDLVILEDYHSRQVVLNYYQDDDFLWKRDGFCFDKVKLSGGCLVFSKKDGKDTKICVNEFPVKVVNSQFPNYYIFQNGSNRLEIYFP